MQRGGDGDSLPKKTPNSLPKVPSPHFPRGPAWNMGWGWNVHMECAGISQHGEGRWEWHWQRSHKNPTSPRRAELPGIPVDPRDNNVEQSFHPGRNVRGTSRRLGSDWARGNAWKLKKINQWAEVRDRSILLTNHFNPRCKIPCWNIPCQVQHHCKELISFAAPKKKRQLSLSLASLSRKNHPESWGLGHSIACRSWIHHFLRPNWANYWRSFWKITKLNLHSNFLTPNHIKSHSASSKPGRFLPHAKKTKFRKRSNRIDLRKEQVNQIAGFSRKFQERLPNPSQGTTQSPACRSQAVFKNCSNFPASPRESLSWTSPPKFIPRLNFMEF